MLITCIIVTLLYTGIAIVECGVLPINQVAGQTLSVLAQKLMPAPLYVVFMIGGPIMALTTTINSSFPVTVEPIRRAASYGIAILRDHAKYLKHGINDTIKFRAQYMIFSA